LRILVVEDDGLVAISIKETLERADHVVVRLASDVDSALAAAAKLSCDLALVDYWLAGDSCGADAVRLLRERYWVPSIFISSHPDNCRKGWEEGGALGCLPKPFLESDLIDAVVIAQTLLAGEEPKPPLGRFELYS
jgi:two-component system, response regulator PdtaR